MIDKLTAWEVTVWDGFQIVYRQSFLGKPDRDKLVEAIYYDAGGERAMAVVLGTTPDLPGSWIGGAPSNGEMAAGCLEHAAKLEALALKVAAGTAEVRFCSYQVIEAMGGSNDKRAETLG